MSTKKAVTVKNIMTVKKQVMEVDVLLLLFRLIAGYTFMMRGWGKIQNPFGWMGPDTAIPGLFQGLAALAEFGGGIALILGLLTRVGALGIACTMVVAIGMHAFVFGDPLLNMSGGSSYELAVLYLLIAGMFFFMGPGRYSADRKIFGMK